MRERKPRLTLKHLHHELERLMATVQELKDKVAAIQADVDAIKAKPVPLPEPVVATQADLDAIGAGLDGVSASLAPLK